MAGIVLLLMLLLGGCDSLYRQLGGNFLGPPGQLNERVGGKARELIEGAFTGIDADRLADYHVHAIAMGTGLEDTCGRAGAAGAYVNPARFSWLNPRWKIPTAVLMSASGISDLGQADDQYAGRLFDLVRNFPGKGVFYLLALDAYHGADGRPDWERTDIHIPNQFVIDLAGCLNDRLPAPRFVPVISVHPGRGDAIDEMRRHHQAGVRFVKWLPNVMNIDPARADYEEFYEEMARLKMTLLTHTGLETTLRVADADHQEFGNPLRLSRALGAGVRVVMAHSGRDGEGRDENGVGTPNFELFLRMMKKPEYEGCLFADISGWSIDDRDSLANLKVFIEDRSLAGRTVNGSDYPLPAAAYLNPTATLADLGLITAEDARALDEIYGYNPLLFDFVVKRTVRLPDGRRLPASMFLSIDDLPAGPGDRCRGYRR